MIVMLMSNQYRINGLEIIQTNHLFTEIRSTIDQDTYSIHINNS